MAKIILLKGLPASGKSTWAKEKIETGNYIRISKDTIRAEMFGRWSKKREREVLKIRNQLIRAALELGKNVIVDDTNLNPIHEKTIQKIAEEYGVDFEVNDSFLEVSPEECVERDLKRPNSVGASVIWGMYEQYLGLSPEVYLEQNWEKRRCVIFDIDGTLAHNTSGRSFYDFSKVGKDTPDPFLTMAIDAINETEDYYVDIIIVSGRDGEYREQTESWLERNAIPYQMLYMREPDDKRDDVVVKEEIYHKFIEPKYAVLGVFDDRPKVCRMWRKLGLNVAQMGNPYIEF